MRYFQDVRMHVWRLGTKDRITNVDSRWSNEARYMPRDSVVDVDAQMRTGKKKAETKDQRCYKSKPPASEGKTPRRAPTNQHWPMNEFLGNGCW